MRTDTRERLDSIIVTVVETVMKTGKPVGSSYVAKHCGLGLKSASIRNYMSRLEDEGFLAQPHTSAGRVPTDKCYRYYIRHLMPEASLSDADIRALKKLAVSIDREYDADVFLQHMVHALSEVTELISVAMIPAFDACVFRRLEILRVGASGYLFIITLDGGMVRTINLRIRHAGPRRAIEDTARLLTERLHGLTIAEIRHSIGRRLKDLRGGDGTLIRVVLENSVELFSFAAERSVHAAGISRYLGQPGMLQVEESRKIASIYEDKETLSLLLGETLDSDRDVVIEIGGLDPLGDNPPLSLVSTAYQSAGSFGAVGVIGPMRLEYPRISALVRYAASITSHYFAGQ